MMPLTQEINSKAWDDYRRHLMQEAQQVWDYAMSRNRWQRYFQDLNEIERRGNVSCLRNRVMSHAAYEAIEKAAKNFEARSSWVRWALLVFTPVGRKVSLYHYLCFAEKLDVLLNQERPNLEAIQFLEGTLARANKRLSGGSKTRVMLQQFWKAVQVKTDQIKVMLGAKPTSTKLRAPRDEMVTDADSVSGVEQELNAEEVRDIRRRCEGVVPASVPIVTATNTAIATTQSVRMRSAPFIQPTAALKRTIAPRKKITDPKQAFEEGKHHLITMLVYELLERVENTISAAAEACVKAKTSDEWLVISQKAKADAATKLVELNSYLSPDKSQEASVYLKKRMGEKLNRCHAQRSNASYPFSLDEDLALLDIHDKDQTELLEEVRQLIKQLTQNYGNLLDFFDRNLETCDYEEMARCTLQLKIIQRGNEYDAIVADVNFIECHTLLLEQKIKQIIARQAEEIEIGVEIKRLREQLLVKQDVQIAIQQQLLKKNDRIIEQADQMIQLVKDTTAALEKQNAFLTTATERTEAGIQAVQSGMEEIRQESGRIQQGINATQQGINATQHGIDEVRRDINMLKQQMSVFTSDRADSAVNVEFKRRSSSPGLWRSAAAEPATALIVDSKLVKATLSS